MNVDKIVMLIIVIPIDTMINRKENLYKVGILQVAITIDQKLLFEYVSYEI